MISFVDYVNPTESELKKWMEDPDSFEPLEQDWDLCVGNIANLKSLVRLAHGEGPQRKYIVHYLYVATADAFNIDRSIICEGIELVPHNTNKHLIQWRGRAQQIVSNPTTFRAKEWFNYIYNQRK